MTTSVLHVAAYILAAYGPMTAMKLQKLCYYSQAWGLVWNDEPLFKEKIEAWANGPVVPELYDVHRGQYAPTDIPGGDPNQLTKYEIETIEKVILFYNQLNSQQLSELTHQEDPWRLARHGIPDGQRGNSEITHASMEEYYSSIE